MGACGCSLLWQMVHPLPVAQRRAMSWQDDAKRRLLDDSEDTPRERPAERAGDRPQRKVSSNPDTFRILGEPTGIVFFRDASQCFAARD